jgi:quinohemoprotein ethanol dehydrogenase
VYAGVAGGDSGGRGQMGAYDVRTGKEVWKFYPVPGPGERFASTWEGDSYKSGGGGIWYGFALDPGLRMIYFATGNAGIVQYGMTAFPHDEGSRGGDNLLTSSIVALDLKTGAYKWHFQEVHHDIWHYDAGGPSVLADITYRGQPRKVLMNPGKTGYLYILDRTNGKPLVGIDEKSVPQEERLKTSRTQPIPAGDPFVPTCPDPLDNYKRGCLFTPYYDEPILIAPGSAGGNTWAPMAFSPKTKLAYVPANILVSVFSHFTKPGDGQFHPPGAERAGTLTAMDPTTNKIVWQKKTKYPMGGGSGLLATAGGLLFHGESDGNLVAYDINNGNELWHFQTGAGANAPVSTFAVDGQQYVAVYAGGNNIALSQRGDQLWVFKLGGTVPEAPPARQPPLIHPGDAGHEQRPATK